MTSSAGRAPGDGQTYVHGVWWLSPVGAVTLVVLPTLWLAVHASDGTFRFDWGSPKTLTSGTAALLATGALVFALGSALPLLLPSRAVRPVRWPDFPDRQVLVLRRCVTPLFWLTAAGYGFFLLSGLLNGLGLATLSAGPAQLKATFGGIPGLTTLTQVGMSFVVVAMLLLSTGPDRRLRRRLVLIVVLALVRAYLVAERLALLEIVIPALAVLALRQTARGRRRSFRLASAAPLALVPLVLVAFGAFEHSRSWVFYESRTSVPYAQWATERFAGYYATAYNNGQIDLTYDRYPGRLPYDSIEALWTAPGISLLGGYRGQDVTVLRGDAFELQGNPEFNSPGGLSIPFVDYGTAGGVVFFLLAGGAIGLAYRSCCSSGLGGVLLYPSLVTGLFELPRYVYWGLGRYSPTLVALCVVYVVARRSSARSQVSLP